MLSSIREKKETSTQSVSKCRSNTTVGKEFNDSREKVRKYIRLTYLIKELLDLVDNRLTKDPRYNLTIGFTTGVELSYLSKDEQRLLYNAIVYLDCTPSYAQGRKLRELSNKKKLSYDSIEKILDQMKGNQNERIYFNKRKIEKVLPKRLIKRDKRYIEDYIIEAIEFYKKYRNIL